MGMVYVCMHAWPLCTGGVTCDINGIDIVIAGIASAAGIAEKPKFVAQNPNNQHPICGHTGDLCGSIHGGTGGCAGEAVHIGGVRDICCCIGKCCDQAIGAVQNRQKSLNLQVTILSTPHAANRMQLLVTKIHEHVISVQNPKQIRLPTIRKSPALIAKKRKEDGALHHGTKNSSELDLC